MPKPQTPDDVVPRHVPGAEDGAVVETGYLRATRTAIANMAARNGVVVVDGQPGLGKTFAADIAIRTVGLPTIWLDMPNLPKGKETVARIYKALTGARPPERLATYILIEDVLDLLTGRRCAIVVDEAQNLNRDSLRQLRYFHDSRDTEFLLALIGCNVRHHVARLCPELVSRVGRWVDFRPFTGAEMRAVLDQYHPLFRNTDGPVLATFFSALGGNFRSWARVLEVATSAGIDPEGGLSAVHAQGILAGMRGTRRR